MKDINLFEKMCFTVLSEDPVAHIHSLNGLKANVLISFVCASVQQAYRKVGNS